MSFDMNPADEDPHSECRHEIERLKSRIATIRAALEEIVCHEGIDAGIILKSDESPTHVVEIGGQKVTVYDNPCFSELGEALISVHKQCMLE